VAEAAVEEVTEEAAGDFFSGAGPAGFASKKAPSISRMSVCCGIF